MFDIYTYIYIYIYSIYIYTKTVSFFTLSIGLSGVLFFRQGGYGLMRGFEPPPLLTSPTSKLFSSFLTYRLSWGFFQDIYTQGKRAPRYNMLRVLNVVCQRGMCTVKNTHFFNIRTPLFFTVRTKKPWVQVCRKRLFRFS